MIVFGIALVVLGAALVALRRFSGERGARTQNAFLGRDVVKAEWVERWNLVFGAALIVAGVIAVAASL